MKLEGSIGAGCNLARTLGLESRLKKHVMLQSNALTLKVVALERRQASSMADFCEPDLPQLRAAGLGGSYCLS